MTIRNKPRKEHVQDVGIKFLMRLTTIQFMASASLQSGLFDTDNKVRTTEVSVRRRSTLQIKFSSDPDNKVRS